MDANPAYIEKLRVAVRIAQFGHDPIDGRFCLTRSAAGPSTSAETVLDLLNSSLRVLPFLVEFENSVRLLTRLNLEWAMAGENVPEEMVLSREERGREEPVEIEFLNGNAIRGTVRIPLSAGFRASDFLNTAPDFYALHTRLGILLVNKLRVRETRLGVEPGSREMLQPGLANPFGGVPAS